MMQAALHLQLDDSAVLMLSMVRMFHCRVYGKGPRVLKQGLVIYNTELYAFDKQFLVCY